MSSGAGVQEKIPRAGAVLKDDGSETLREELRQYCTVQNISFNRIRFVLRDEESPFTAVENLKIAEKSSSYLKNNVHPKKHQGFTVYSYRESRFRKSI